MGAGGNMEHRKASQSGAESVAKAIGAHYYNVSDTTAAPVAGLLVLLDGQQQPVRAELHLYEDLPSHIQEGAVRESRQILLNQYQSEATIPVRIMETSQMRDAVEVRLAESGTPVRARNRLPVPFFALLGTVAIVVLVLLAAFALGGSQGLTLEDLPRIDELAGAAAVQEMSVAGPSLDAAEGVTETVQLDLPVSRNARDDLSVGMRVAIVPGLRLTLRSEPGADAGVPVGYMMDDDTAVIVEGPRLTEGTSDTIVWWLVRLDDGTEAWAAANTSDKTLLIPSQQ